MKAFPAKGYITSEDGVLGEAQYAGMDLVDYFAAKAMQSILTGSWTISEPFEVAKKSYEYANAMIKFKKEMK